LSDLSNEINDILQRKTVADAVDSLVDAAKLSVQDAKTCIYWRLGTKYLDELDFYPALALVGAAGSGKNTIMRALQALPAPCSGIIDCGSMSAPTARDELSKHLNSTFFADEFDNIRPEVQRIFMSRTTRDMATQIFKKLYKQKDYVQVVVNIFGATVLHKRNLIDDAAFSSRAIQVFTRHQDGPYGKFELDFTTLDAITLDMSAVILHGGRIETTWSPVLEVARQLGDEDFVAEVTKTLEIETRLLRQKSEYDHSSVILAQLIEVLLSRPTLSRWYKIDIETYIGKPIRVDYPSIVPITVNSVLNTLGFHTDRQGGRRWLYPSIEAIQIAAQRCNYHDSAIQELGSEFGLHF
jgi:energy-coupling factor transporter ATP-binding protein EcfA2